MKEMIMILNGINDDMIKDQYLACDQYLAEAMNILNDNSEENAEWVAEGSHYVSYTEVASKQGVPKMSVLMRRPDIKLSDEATSYRNSLKELMDADHTREFIAPDASETLINATVAHGLTDAGATVTIADEKLSFRPGAARDDIKRTLTIHRDATTTDDGAEIIEEKWAGGRPPLGTRVDAGRLVKDDNYDDVRVKLQMVAAGNKTKAAAAAELGCARGTIDNAIEDRAAMYQLRQQ